MSINNSKSQYANNKVGWLAEEPTINNLRLIAAHFEYAQSRWQ